jgi:hypothetical protein
VRPPSPALAQLRREAPAIDAMLDEWLDWYRAGRQLQFQLTRIWLTPWAEAGRYWGWW